jgi:PAS domain S-box-containing protein
MSTFFQSLPLKSLEQERLKGVRINIYFRWLLIIVVLGTLTLQLLKGYKAESLMSMIPISVYILSNIGLVVALRKNYNPAFLGYLTALLDVAIISLHLYFSTARYDFTAATAAASIFLFPALFILYTFQLRRPLMVFLIVISLSGFNLVYFLHYLKDPSLYDYYLSLSPLSHFFKTVYLFFIGFLCLYMQQSLSDFIEKQLREAAARVRLDSKIRFEEEKNSYAQKLIEQEKTLNKSLEEEIAKREIIAFELQKSREQLQGILSNLVGAVYRCLNDEKFTVEYLSDKFIAISGYPPDDFVHNNIRSFSSVIHPDDIEFCRKNIAEAVLHKAAYEFEYRIIHRNGNIVWVKENGQGITDTEGKILYLDGIIIDVTLRKEAEMAVKESEKNYKEMLDFLPQPIFELDLEGKILLSNKAGDEFFGKLPDEKEERVSALDFFVKEDIPRIIENFRKSAMGVKTEASEFTAIKKDGSHCPVMVFGTAIYRNEKIVGRRGIIVDISERKKYEQGLIDAKLELERINSTLEQNVADRTRQLTKANTQLLKLQKENLQSQFEVLKQQVNPHFLFNSLNVLTSLIKVDPNLAETFTERLSKVYRYVLENKEKDLVPLSTELAFLDAYLFLIEIRFMKKIFIKINIEKSFYDYQILPIAIQLLIENAIKHNTFSKLEPLRIELTVDNEANLIISNNLNLRETKFISTGVGLENIKRRYVLVSDKHPEFSQTEAHFVAKLPLLKPDKYEF